MIRLLGVLSIASIGTTEAHDGLPEQDMLENSISWYYAIRDDIEHELEIIQYQYDLGRITEELYLLHKSKRKQYLEKV